MKQKGFVPVLIVLVIAIMGVAGYFGYKYFRTANQPSTLAPTNSPIPSINPIPATPLASPTPKIPTGWQTYTNSQYGFEISFPSNFKALTDSTNLYGWPNAVVLIYSGGQSYDLPIEVWGSEAAYKAKYPNASQVIVFKTKDGKFITLTNINTNPTVTEIISTFKFVQ